MPRYENMAKMKSAVGVGCHVIIKTRPDDIEPYKHLRSGIERTCYSHLMQKHPMIYNWHSTGTFDGSERAYNERRDALINGYPVPILARQPGDIGYEEARPLLEALAKEIISEEQCQNFYDLSCQEVSERGQDEIRDRKLAEFKKIFPVQNTQAVPEIKLICSRCKQLNWHARTGGQFAEEPQWRSALSIAKFSTPNACVELSNKYPEFSEVEMTSKLDGIDKPFFCSTIEDYRPHGCDGCKYKGFIRSPMKLGFQFEPRIGGKK